ncbi:MAG: putative integral rane protein [Actinoallomurus sp.]|nr:putative integral rane protein [Actinoallomurus sp.]
MTAQGTRIKATGRQVSSSTPFRMLARSGLAARGATYILIGFLATQIAFGKGGKDADRQGALQTVAKTPGGTVLLWLLAIGLAGMALWRLSEAVYGQTGPDGHTATKRLSSLGRAIFYAVVCSSTVAFIIGSGGPGSSDKKSKDLTAKAMHDIPGGRWLVLLVGLGFIAGGIGIAVQALRTKFEKKLNTHQMSPQVRKAVKAIGTVGLSTRALIYAAAGVFLAYAAITYDPGKAKGVDGTLRQFATTSAGPWLLVLIALGLIVFGIYSFCEARWRRI